MKFLVSRAEIILFVASVAIVTGVSADNGRETNWTVRVYGGGWSNNRIGDIILLQTQFEHSHVWAMSFSRRVVSVSDILDAEMEFNCAGHSGLQSHFESNCAFVLRWNRFPWDRFVNTSLAYGLGPSCAFRRPPIEHRERRGPTYFLVFMPVEMTFGPPLQTNSRWDILVRIHHRSGAYGVVSDSGGSNFVTLGFRYRFPS